MTEIELEARAFRELKKVLEATRKTMEDKNNALEDELDESELGEDIEHLLNTRLIKFIDNIFDVMEILKNQQNINEGDC